MPGQRRQRDAELDARLAAVAHANALRDDGLRSEEVTALLGVTSRTLRRWIDLARNDALKAKPIGRPAKRGPAHARAALLGELALRPRLGVPTLRAQHPDLGRREIEELSARARSVLTTRRRDLVEALTWTQPGSVWAVDFSDVGLDIEGTYTYLLLVRDLATGYELLALPCRAQDAATVRAALSALFKREGAPLVLKADNGGGFIAAAVADLLAAHKVLLLRSPAYTPEYNGACEAGGGSIKTRAHHLAAAHGREACWSCDDVESARMEANEAPRTNGPTPGERWRGRSPLPAWLRASLRDDVARRVSDELAARRLGLCATIDDRIIQQVARAAIAGSLRERSLLSSRLTSIPARRGPRRTDKREGKGKPEEVTCSS
jgi:transposase InsO family protein